MNYENPIILETRTEPFGKLKTHLSRTGLHTKHNRFGFDKPLNRVEGHSATACLRNVDFFCNNVFNQILNED